MRNAFMTALRVGAVAAAWALTATRPSPSGERSSPSPRAMPSTSAMV